MDVRSKNVWMRSGCCVQNLFHQIVQHELVAAGEGLDEASGVWMSLQGQRGQVQAGNPAFGAPFQGGDVLSFEGETHPLGEKLRGFGSGKPQVGGAQFGQLAPGTEPGQGQWWIFTGGDDQVHPRGQMLDEIRERLVNRFGIEQVVVVQDQDEMVRNGGQVIEQGRQQRFDGWGLRGLEHPHQPSSNRWRKGLHRRDEVRQKAGGVILLCVQRQPGRWCTAFGQPLREQGGFAKTGGGRDERERTLRSLRESREEMRAAHEVRAWQGSIELGGQQQREDIVPHPRCGSMCRVDSCLGSSLRRGLDERSSQGLGHCLEPRQREGLGPAEIVGSELAVLRAVGFPVPAPTLVARALFARGEGACLAGKGKGGGRLQPGIPGGRFHQERLLLLIVLIGQRVSSD